MRRIGPEEPRMNHLVFLVGFDRSGSSMIARLLAHHPQVNLLFHPFNNTEVTHSQWEYWGASENHPETAAFLNKLMHGEVDMGYIKSDWLANYSKSLDLNKYEITLVKDTKFHFKIAWLKTHLIRVFGIWRDPRAILYSLVRNDFHLKWYGNVDDALLRGVTNAIIPFQKYLAVIDDAQDHIERMAIAIAMRMEMLKMTVLKPDWLVYEDILADPNLHLNAFLSAMKLEPFDFKPLIEQDYNVIGKKFEQPDGWKSFFSQAQQERLNTIFQYIL